MDGLKHGRKEGVEGEEKVFGKKDQLLYLWIKDIYWLEKGKKSRLDEGTNGGWLRERLLTVSLMDDKYFKEELI